MARLQTLRPKAQGLLSHQQGCDGKREPQSGVQCAAQGWEWGEQGIWWGKRNRTADREGTVALEASASLRAGGLREFPHAPASPVLAAFF